MGEHNVAQCAGDDAGLDIRDNDEAVLWADDIKPALRDRAWHVVARFPGTADHRSRDHRTYSWRSGAPLGVWQIRVRVS